MSSLNKVMLIGRLGKDPEVRTLPSGEAVASFSLATSETWTDRATNQKQEKTEWHNIVYFGRVAEICRDYLKKGSLIYVEGSLQTRKWTDKNGVDRYTTDIKGSEMKMLSSKGDTGGSTGYSAPAPSPASNYSAPAPANAPADNGFKNVDDDIPF